MLELREEQQLSLDSLREGFRQGNHAQVLYGPCGFGKTELAIALLDATAKKGNRATMIMDRRILVEQTSQRLDKYGVDHGVMMSGHWRYRPHEPVQIASAQTLEAMREFPASQILIVDEAHCLRKETVNFIKNTGIRSIGLTGSPFTKGMGKIYSNVVSEVTINEMVSKGWLAPLIVYAAKEIDMTGAKKVAGEWSQKEAAERGIRITGDVVSEWVSKTYQVFGGPRKTIVFSAGVEHGADLARKFEYAGYNFIAISYKDYDNYKREVIEEFSKKDTDIHGLIATDILTKGFDQDDVLIGVSARPFSKSFSSHVQQMGRVMRSSPGKEFALWICHSGNYIRFREDWEDLYFNGVKELDDGKEKPKPEPTDKEKEESRCPKCTALWPPRSDTCASCGHVRKGRNEITAVPGELSEVDTPKKDKYSSEYKELFYRELLKYSRDKGYSDGFAFHAYKDKFKLEPKWRKEPADNVGENVMNFIKYKNIRFAKSKHRRRA